MVPSTFTETYCSLELAKRMASNVEGMDDDPFFKALMVTSSRFIDEYTNRYWGASAVVSGEAVRRIMGPSHNIFYSRFAPIMSIASLADDTTVYVTPDDYTFFGEEGRVELYSLTNLAAGRMAAGYAFTQLFPRSFSSKPGSVLMSYVVGQGTPQAAEMMKSSAPYPVQAACAILAATLYQEPGRLGVLSRASQQENTVYLQDAFPKKAKLLLDTGYKRNTA